jgi:hypothetical protein
MSLSKHAMPKKVPNPEIIIGHGFEHHIAISFVPFVYTLQDKWATLQGPVHAIDASKHLRKSSTFILCHDAVSSSFGPSK